MNASAFSFIPTSSAASSWICFCAAYSRTSCVIFMEQKGGPHIEQKWASNSLNNSLHRAFVAEQFCHLGLFVLQLYGQRRLATIVFRIDVSPMVEQQLGEFDTAVTGSLVQWIPSVAVPRIDIPPFRHPSPANFYP